MSSLLTPGRSSKVEARAEEPFVRRAAHVAIARRCSRSRAARAARRRDRSSRRRATCRQVSPPNAPAFIASAPPSVPGMPAKNSAGPRPHLMHCLASFAHAHAAAAPDLVVAAPLELVEHAVRLDHRAANAAVAHQQVAAEADPHHRRVRLRGCAGTPQRSATSSGREEQIRRPAHVPRRVLRHRLVAPHARFEIGRQRQCVHGRLRSTTDERRQRGRQLGGGCADAARAHGHDHVAVARDLDQRARQLLDLLDEHGSTRPCERTARQIALPSAPAIGASPAA